MLCDADRAGELDAELTEMLRKVTRHLGLEFGIISQVQGGLYRVAHVWAADGAVRRGAEFPLGRTYCSLTLGANDIVAFGHAEGTDFASHPAYSAFGLQSYIGTPIRTRGATTGTLNFSSRVARSKGYTETERDLVRLFASWVGRTVDRLHVTQELRRAVSATEELRKCLEAIIQASPGGIIVHRNRRILWLNDATCQLLGGKVQELVGRSLSEFVAPPVERNPSVDPSLPPPAPPLSPPTSIAMRKVNGEVAWVEMVGVPATWEGEPAVFSFVRDKTHEQESQALLVQSERLASIGTLAAGVAHELNNPLAYVMANLDVATEELVAIEGATPSARMREIIAALADAREGSLRARKTVRDLRTFSRVDEEVRAVHNLHRLLEVAISMSMNEVRHHATLKRDFGGVPLVAVDESRLTQVFVNLLVNASQAIAETKGGDNTITVKTHTDSHGWAVVEIEDTGAGIPAELLPHIFEPFTTTKPPGMGTGLGLSVSRQIVAGVGGRMTAENRGSGGALMRVRLPPSTENSEPERRAFGDRSEGPRGKKILVVDDDVMIGRALKRAIGRENLLVVCDGAKEALGVLAKNNDFDVVLCDLMMPDVPGWEFYGTLQEEMPQLAQRLVFITGGSVGETARQFLEGSACPVVEKPFDVAALRAVVNRLGEPRWAQTNSAEQTPEPCGGTADSPKPRAEAAGHS